MTKARLHNLIATGGLGDEALRQCALNETESCPASSDGENKAEGLVFRPSSLLRSLKALAFFLYLYSGYVALRDLVLSLLGRSRAVVVYYHRVGASDVLTKTVEEFRADLAYLKKHYECISLAELSERLVDRRPLRRRAAVITFDDGYRDNHSKAVPLLKEAGLPATFFVATGYIGTVREFPHDHSSEPPAARPASFPKLGWDDLRAMERDGFEIGSHTVNHTNLAQAGAEEVEFEIVSSLHVLNLQLGKKPRPFSFPWGTPAHITDEALKTVRDAGYYAACSAYGGANGRNGDPIQIMRVDAGNGGLGRLATRARIAGLDPDHFRSVMGRFKSQLQKRLRGLRAR